MSFYQRHKLPRCIVGFEHINRYYDDKNDIFTAKILPGEFYVSKQGEMITTVLGSCISACIRDPIVGVGGMNHFMLPVDRRTKSQRSAIDLNVASRYGDFAMEMMINEILKAGGKRKNLEVKLFGGGRVVRQIRSVDIGKQNIDFAHNYLAFEGLGLVAEDTGGDYPRKVNYFSDSGRVMLRKLKSSHNNTITVREETYYSRILKTADVSGELEQFK